MTAPATGIEAMTPGRLAALVASRLCHDLVSPLGAIGNGVELLQLAPATPAGASPELALVAESVAAARARIASFRLAFGQAGGEARMGRGDLAAALADLTAAGRLKAELAAEGDAARAEVKMILLGVMCLETALPWGGRVLVCRTGAGWRLVAEAQRTRLDPALWAWLGGGGARRPPTPAEVQFALLAEEAAAQSRRLTWELDDTGGEIAF